LHPKGTYRRGMAAQTFVLFHLPKCYEGNGVNQSLHVEVMRRLVILTSMDRGLASLALPRLKETHDLAGIIKVEQTGGQKSGLRRKLKKVGQIGLLGALNGIRIRPWFMEEPMARLGIRSLEEVARECGVPIHRVPFTNTPETIEAMQSLAPEIGISLGNSFISRSVFSIPSLGMINIHHEVLPEYKGAQSVVWQLFNGSTQTGYTIHKVNDKIDGGDILSVERRPIKFGRDLHETVVRSVADIYAASVDGLLHTLDGFEELARSTRPQVNTASYTTPSIWQFLRMVRQHRKLALPRR
jgi:methionyl-tRNA formyltransferase